MKVIELPACRRRVLQSKGMFCRVPLRGDMPAQEYITLVRNNPTHQITCDDCLRCEMVNTTETVRIPPQKPIKDPPVRPTIDPVGTLRYAARGWEPPPRSILHNQAVLEGREWVLTLKEPKCQYLEMSLGANIGGCGCFRILTKCTRGKGNCPCPDHTK